MIEPSEKHDEELAKEYEGETVQVYDPDTNRHYQRTIRIGSKGAYIHHGGLDYYVIVIPAPGQDTPSFRKAVHALPTERGGLK